MIDQGVINFFRKEKGYGFIESDSFGRIFYHITNFAEEVDENILCNGIRVSFEVGNNWKGKYARNIKIIGF